MVSIFAFIVFFSGLAFPPTLLSTKFITKKPNWRLIILLSVIYVLFGWVFIFSAFVVDQIEISELIRQDRSEELPEGWDSDGGRGVGAAFAGWLIPLSYFLFWFTVYALAAMVRRLFKLGGEPNKSSEQTKKAR
jgi:hypothetical protein